MKNIIIYILVLCTSHLNANEEVIVPVSRIEQKVRDSFYNKVDLKIILKCKLNEKKHQDSTLALLTIEVLNKSYNLDISTLWMNSLNLSKRSVRNLKVHYYLDGKDCKGYFIDLNFTESLPWGTNKISIFFDYKNKKFVEATSTISIEPVKFKETETIIKLIK